MKNESPMDVQRDEPLSMASKRGAFRPFLVMPFSRPFRFEPTFGQNPLSAMFLPLDFPFVAFFFFLNHSTKNTQTQTETVEHAGLATFPPRIPVVTMDVTEELTSLAAGELFIAAKPTHLWLGTDTQRHTETRRYTQRHRERQEYRADIEQTHAHRHSELLEEATLKV